MKKFFKFNIILVFFLFGINLFYLPISKSALISNRESEYIDNSYAEKSPKASTLVPTATTNYKIFESKGKIEISWKILDNSNKITKIELYDDVSELTFGSIENPLKSDLEKTVFFEPININSRYELYLKILWEDELSVSFTNQFLIGSFDTNVPKINFFNFDSTLLFSDAIFLNWSISNYKSINKIEIYNKLESPAKLYYSSSNISSNSLQVNNLLIDNLVPSTLYNFVLKISYLNSSSNQNLIIEQESGEFTTLADTALKPVISYIKISKISTTSISIIYKITNKNLITKLSIINPNDSSEYDLTGNTSSSQGTINIINLLPGISYQFQFKVEWNDSSGAPQTPILSEEIMATTYVNKETISPTISSFEVVNNSITNSSVNISYNIKNPQLITTLTIIDANDSTEYSSMKNPINSNGIFFIENLESKKEYSFKLKIEWKELNNETVHSILSLNLNFKTLDETLVPVFNDISISSNAKNSATIRWIITGSNLVSSLKIIDQNTFEVFYILEGPIKDSGETIISNLQPNREFYFVIKLDYLDANNEAQQISSSIIIFDNDNSSNKLFEIVLISSLSFIILILLIIVIYFIIKITKQKLI